MNVKSILKKKEKKINVELTCSELNSVIEALLFASSVNICADWETKQSEDFVDLAINLKNKIPASNLSLKNITYYDDADLQESWTQKIQQNFCVDCFNVETLKS
jgi:hypothetical protein